MWEEYFIYNADFTSPVLSGGSGTSFQDEEVRISPDAAFNLYGMNHVATSDIFRLELRDDSNGRFIQKNTVDARCVSTNSLSSITANGFQLFKWGKPYQLKPGTTFNVRGADGSGSDNTVRISLHGAKLREGIAPWKRKNYTRYEHYIYPLTTSGNVVVAADGTTSRSIATDRGADFIVTQITGLRTASALINIKDSARDAQWMNSDSHFDNIVGNGTFPNRIIRPRFIPGGGVISVTLTDLSSSANTIELYIIGVKAYE